MSGDGRETYEISILVGPCRESEAEDLCLELAEWLKDKRGWFGSYFAAALSVGPLSAGFRSTHTEREER